MLAGGHFVSALITTPPLCGIPFLSNKKNNSKIGQSSLKESTLYSLNNRVTCFLLTPWNLINFRSCDPILTILSLFEGYDPLRLQYALKTYKFPLKMRKIKSHLALSLYPLLAHLQIAFFMTLQNGLKKAFECRSILPELSR